LYFNVTYSIKYNTFLVINQPFMISSIAWITNVTKSVFWNILVTERNNQQSIKFLFFNITTKFTSYYSKITPIKLINYYWSLCQCSHLISFRINDLIYMLLSGILVWAFSMTIKSCWTTISFSSNPESFKYWPMKLLIVQWLY
jgi:hypothetical protein